MIADALVYDLDDVAWRELGEQRMRRRRPPVFRHYTLRAAIWRPRHHTDDCAFWSSVGEQAMRCDCSQEDDRPDERMDEQEIEKEAS